MSGAAKGGIPEEHEEHVNHERWLVTYADMVTLLMVLFIVLFAMGQTDERKYAELKSGLAAGFANSASILPGSESLLDGAGTSPLSSVAPAMIRQNGDGGGGTTAEQAVRKAADATAKTRLKALAEVSGLRDVSADIDAALAAQGLGDDVETSVDDRGLVISLVSKHVTFRSGDATLSPLGEKVVDTLGPILAGLPQDIEVGGNTNQQPGTPAAFATDWDLSAARAVTVLRRLNEVQGIPAPRLRVAAYGNTRPLMDPAEPGSQAVNKRVDLVLLSGSDEATRALVEDLANGEQSGQAPAPDALADLPELPALPATPAGPEAGDVTTAALIPAEENTP